MKLYGFPIAPNPTRVRLYLAEKGIEIPTVRVSLVEGEQRQPAFLAKNAMGKLPVLELDDGSFVNESQAIVEYLEERFPDPPMIGRDPETRLRVRSIERHCDLHVLLNVGRYIHATDSPLGLPPSPPVAALAREQLDQALTVLEARIGDRPFVAGDFVSIADCTLWAACNFAGFRNIDLGLEGRPRIQRWQTRFAKRPSTALSF